MNEKKNTYLLLIAIFPVLDIGIAYFLYGDFLQTFYSLFSILIIFIFIIGKGKLQISYSISKREFYVLSISVLCVVINILFIEGKFNTAVLDTMYFVLLMEIYNKKQFIQDYLDTLYCNSKLITICSIIYLIFLVMSVYRGDAFSLEWATKTLKGPYSIPHILAYELLVMSTVNFVVYQLKNKKINLLLAGVFLVIILLTAVRGAILAEIVLLLYYFYKIGMKKKFVIICCASMLLVYGIFNSNIFNYLTTSLMEKNSFAVASGSLDNGRINIWKASLQSFSQTKGYIKWLFGIGYSNLLSGNKANIGMAIQAHNDFVSVFVCFGVTYFIMFIRGFIKLIAGKNCLWALVFFVILAGFNGIVFYMPMVIGCINMIVFYKQIFDKSIRGKNDNN